VSFEDVSAPKDRLIDSLWREQCKRWPHGAQNSEAPPVQPIPR
jgi:hypothetical protein